MDSIAKFMERLMQDRIILITLRVALILAVSMGTVYSTALIVTVWRNALGV